MIRVYTVEEYIAGLKAQNIVVYPLLEERIRELNRQGIVQGCFPMTGDLIPIKDMRYSAGYVDQSNQIVNQGYYQPNQGIDVSHTLNPNKQFNTSNNYETYVGSPEYNIAIKLTLKEAVNIAEEALKRNDTELAFKVMKEISSSLLADAKVNG